MSSLSLTLHSLLPACPRGHPHTCLPDTSTNLPAAHTFAPPSDRPCSHLHAHPHARLPQPVRAPTYPPGTACPHACLSGRGITLPAGPLGRVFPSSRCKVRIVSDREYTACSVISSHRIAPRSSPFHRPASHLRILATHPRSPRAPAPWLCVDVQGLVLSCLSALSRFSFSVAVSPRLDQYYTGLSLLTSKDSEYSGLLLDHPSLTCLSTFHVSFVFCCDRLGYYFETYSTQLW